MFRNETLKQKWVMGYVFLVLFFALGILPFWAAFDVSYLGSNFLNWLFGGIYTDFVSDWFEDVIGFMVQVYRIQICFPLIEFTTKSVGRHVKRVLDQCKFCPTDMTRTKTPTMAMLYDKYMGPDFHISYKYSYILVYVFVAFTWGTVVPLMFLLSTVGLTIMFIVERMMVHYSYNHPPMLDNAMMEQALKMLFVAPFGLCLVGAWAFSNREVYHVNQPYAEDNSI